MPIWKILSVSDEPDTKLLDWRVFEVQQSDREGRTRHFVGSVGRDYDGQSSSAIVEFDPSTRRGLSELGHIYQLMGRGSGIGMNADYVWCTWKRKAGATDSVDVTDEIKKLISTQQLKAAVDVGIADSDVDRFTEVSSSEALSAHLAALRTAEKLDSVSVLLTAPCGEPLDLPRDRQDEGDI